MTSDLLQHADPDIRPQDDLYRFVNGAWLNTATIPDDLPGTGAFYILRDQAEEAVGELIDETVKVVEPNDSQERISALYRSFLDTEAVSSSGHEPLLGLLQHADTITDPSTLAGWSGWAARRGITNLMSMSVDADPGEPNRVVLFVGQSGLGLPDEEYFRSESFAAIREAYLAHLERMFALIGSGDPAGEAAATMTVETAIATLHWDKVRTRDLREMYNLQSFEELTGSTEGFDWDAFHDSGELPASAFAQVVNAQPSYFSGLPELIMSLPFVAWRSWARWHTISAFAAYLSDEFVDADFAFYGTALSGTPTLKERWKRGVALVERSVGEDVGKLYVERFFPPAAKTRIDALVANVIEAYRRSISTLEWMTEDTRAEALRKLSKFRAKIGYPDKWKDYSALHFDADDLVGNVLKVRSWSVDDELDKLSRPTDRDEWMMTPQTVNAYYHPLRNEIVFPAAILQPPFFDPEVDDAVNYGGIGAVIGHEIGHGFDDQGSTCDGDGRLRNWWTDADREAFERRTKVLIDQYGELSPEGADGAKVNGQLTIGENIGDLGGLSIAYAAWLVSDPDPDELIDDIPTRQRLFYNWAVVWQSKMRPEAMRQRLATDPHSPPEFRANQTPRNVDAFHEAFGTSEEDLLWLAPGERVKIW